MATHPRSDFMNANKVSPHQSTTGAVASLKTALRDTYQGFFDITHNSLALMGTLLAAGAPGGTGRRLGLRRRAQRH
jgi:hypothetical protein